MQFNASFKKEWLEVTRTFRILAFILVFMAFALIDPAMMMVIPKLMEVLQTAGAGDLASIFKSDQMVALQSFVGDALQVGILVLLLGMMRAAGGDQKKRTCIIPICSGMRRDTYVLAKFALYPILAAVCSFAAYLLAYGWSCILFKPMLSIGEILLPACAMAIFVFFNACLMLFIGISTGKAGISVVIVFAMNMLAQLLLTPLKLNHYNPYALMSLAADFQANALDFLISGAVTLLVCGILLALTTAAFRQKKLL